MKVIIADDHAIVRQGLQQIVSMQRSAWPRAAEASSADELLSALRRETFDVVVLDVTLGDRSGIELLGHIRAEFPSTPVLMLSMHAEEQYAIRCLRAGAAGYIQKDRSPAEILEAIERIASGRTYMSEAVAEQLAAEVLRGAGTLPHERLSDREFEVFRQIAAGRSVSEIADAMNLSVKTVSTYRTRILAKTGFRTNADIIRYAFEHTLL